MGRVCRPGYGRGRRLGIKKAGGRWTARFHPLDGVQPGHCKVITDVAVRAPFVAVIVAVPAATPVTTPVKGSTVATATSLLVKTAIHGGDPNWGRLIAVAGRAGVAFELGHAKVAIGPIVLFKDSLKEAKVLADKDFEEIENQAVEATARAVKFADESPLPNESELLKDVFA